MDSTERERREHLRAAAAALVEQGAVALALVREGRVVCASDAFRRAFALRGPDGAPVAQLATAGHREALASTLERAAAPGASPQGLSFEALRGDTVFEADAIASAARFDDGPAVALLVCDLTERRRTEQRLSYAAYVDEPTGLPNAVLLLDRLREAVTTARRGAQRLALFRCSVDGVAALRARAGDATADAALRNVVDRLAGGTRGGDTLARLGPDELAVLLCQLDRRDSAALVAGRLVRTLQEPVIVGGHKVPIRLSVGIATFPDEGATPAALMELAEAARMQSARATDSRYTFAVSEETPPPRPPLVQLTEEHMVGVEEIDAQHAAITDLLNNLVDGLHSGRSLHALVASMGELVDFTAAHFAAEERLMQLHGPYFGEVEHILQHRQLLDDLRSLTVQLDPPGLELAMRWLQGWFVQHLERQDKPLGRWLRERGVG